MKELVNVLTFLAVLVLVNSCQNPAPSLDEVIAKVEGKYCSEAGDYVLELKSDSTFVNRRSLQSLIQGKTISETCKGVYALKYDGTSNQWWLHFTMKKSALTTSDCSGKELVWDMKEGYTADQSGGMMKERMQNTAVYKGKCSY